MSCRPLSSTAPHNSAHSAAVSAIGFSTKTCLPARSASSACGGVLLIPADNQHRVNLRVFKNLVVFAGGVLRAEA